MKIRSTIDLPSLPRVPEYLKGVLRYLERLRQVIKARDLKMAEAVNSYDMEIVDAAPSDAPDGPAPQVKLYKDATDGWRLYVYTGPDGWVYFNHS